MSHGGEGGTETDGDRKRVKEVVMGAQKDRNEIVLDTIRIVLNTI